MKIQIKSSFAFAGLLLFLSNAAANNNHDTFSVYTSSPNYTAEAKLTALSLKPSATNTHFAAEAFPLPILSPNWKIHDICKKYHLGFDAQFKTQIHKTNSAIFANWEHFKSCDRTKFETNSNNMVGPFFEIGPDADKYFKAEGSVKFKFNEANLDYGQNISFGDHLTTNIFIGFSFMQICENFNSAYAESTTVFRTIETPTKFQGYGPQFGADFTYDIVKGFGLTGRLAGSILSGKSSNHTTYTSSNPELETLGSPNPNIQNTTVNCISLIVPSIFQKIGLDYIYEFRDHYAIRAEIGYQAQIYFNALQAIDMGSEVITPPQTGSIGVYARTFQRNISNFALSGAYFALEVGF